MAQEEILVLKRRIVDAGIHMIRSGLTYGTSGNISARVPGMDCFYITPSGMAYESLRPEDIVGVDLDGRVVDGARRPSIEHMMHAAILRARADVAAVVHTHSTYATAVASARLAIPPFLETLIAATRGREVRVAEFAPAGSRELAEVAVRALGGDSAVLLANHGVIGVGRDLDEAMNVCEIVERAAMVFLLSRLAGGPAPVPEEVVNKQVEFLKANYGQLDDH
ncbi:MAG: class II aldolase/adducin family protein [Firmicutes bacterium]|jgi:L-fuculose-phosphate aldolase|nr:class II aldolase/adducin family protein [Bacillota bacterium]MDH7495212.1 class II aldolase/adducin family protein [Bacillota bacterium]